MLIRKKFKFEGSHIVRNCETERCSKSIHGHSYVIEVALQRDALDKAGMVMDFTRLKQIIGPEIDKFDHTHLIWSEDNDEYRAFSKQYSDRWIELPFNPSAEMLACYFHDFLEKKLRKDGYPRDLYVQFVRIHETETGYAETDKNDVRFIRELLAQGGEVIYSDSLK